MLDQAGRDIVGLGREHETAGARHPWRSRLAPRHLLLRRQAANSPIGRELVCKAKPWRPAGKSRSIRNRCRRGSRMAAAGRRHDAGLPLGREPTRLIYFDNRRRSRSVCPLSLRLHSLWQRWVLPPPRRRHSLRRFSMPAMNRSLLTFIRLHQCSRAGYGLPPRRSRDPSDADRLGLHVHRMAQGRRLAGNTSRRCLRCLAKIQHGSSNALSTAVHSLLYKSQLGDADCGV